MTQSGQLFALASFHTVEDVLKSVHSRSRFPFTSYATQTGTSHTCCVDPADPNGSSRFCERVSQGAPPASHRIAIEMTSAPAWFRKVVNGLASSCPALRPTASKNLSTFALPS